MSDEPEEPRVQHSGWMRSGLIVLVLVLLIYPLSIGPADVLASRLNNETFNKMAMIFYRPLVSASNAAGTRDQFEAYFKWCHWVTNTPLGPNR
jgi:hypothetical protein